MLAGQSFETRRAATCLSLPLSKQKRPGAVSAVGVGCPAVVTRAAVQLANLAAFRHREEIDKPKAPLPPPSPRGVHLGTPSVDAASDPRYGEKFKGKFGGALCGQCVGAQAPPTAPPSSPPRQEAWIAF